MHDKNNLPTVLDQSIENSGPSLPRYALLKASARQAFTGSSLARFNSIRHSLLLIPINRSDRQSNSQPVRLDYD